MPIYVKWIWKCDLCGIEMHDQYKTSVYADEMTGDNRGWISDMHIPEEYRSHPCLDICIACPECKAKEKIDWSRRYRERE